MGRKGGTQKKRKWGLVNTQLNRMHKMHCKRLSLFREVSPKPVGLSGVGISHSYYYFIIYDIQLMQFGFIACLTGLDFYDCSLARFIFHVCLYLVGFFYRVKVSIPSTFNLFWK